MVSSRSAFFDSDYVYSEGLTFAFALTAYDGDKEPIEDPSIGVLKPYYRTWGLKGDTVGTSFDPLPERACNEAELHIDDTVTANQSPWYQPHPNYLSDLGWLNKKLKCLDVDEI